MDHNFYAFMAHLYKDETVRQRYRAVRKYWDDIVGEVGEPFNEDGVNQNIDTYCEQNNIGQNLKTNILEAFRLYARFISFWSQTALTIEHKMEEKGRRQSFHARTVTDTTDHVFTLDGMYASIYDAIHCTMCAKSNKECLLVLIAIEFPYGTNLDHINNVQIINNNQNHQQTQYTHKDAFYIRKHKNGHEFVYPVAYNGPKQAKVKTRLRATQPCSTELSKTLNKLGSKPGKLLDINIKEFKLKDWVLRTPFTPQQVDFLSSFLANQLFRKIFKLARVAKELQQNPQTDTVAHFARFLGVSIGREDTKYRLNGLYSIQRAKRVHDFIMDINDKKK